MTAIRPLRVLVVDDELVGRRRLVRLLADFEDVTLAGECDGGQGALDRTAAGDVDVVILDVQMPGLSGLETAQRLVDRPDGGPGRAPVVVLCTAHPDHALEAFECGAADYLLKPADPARLRRALDRARAAVAARDAEAGPGNGPVAPGAAGTPGTDGSASKPLDRLAIPTKQGIVLVSPTSVSHAVIEGELVRIVSEEGEYLSDDPLGDLHERLRPLPFERVHRRAILNLEHVQRLEPTDTGGMLARTRTGHVVEISRQAARELRRRLGIR